MRKKMGKTEKYYEKKHTHRTERMNISDKRRSLLRDISISKWTQLKTKSTTKY